MSRSRLALLLVGLAVGLALAERGLVRPLRPEPASERDAEWQAALREMHGAIHKADPDLVYVPRAGATVVMDYGLAGFNGQGLREHRQLGREPDADARVAVLGDSLVWGELLAREHTLPARLDQALGREAEVLNFGVTGYDTVQEAEWYRRSVRAFSPDLVLLVFCLDDLLTRSGPYEIFGDSDRLRALALERAWLDRQAPLRNETLTRLWQQERRGEGSQVVAAWRHLRRWHTLFTLPGSYIDDILLSSRAPARKARLEHGLEQLGRDLARDRVRGVLLISPVLDRWHAYPWAEVHSLVRGLAEDAGFAVLDPVHDWSGGDPEPLRFPGDNLHFTPTGTAFMTDWLVPCLRAELALGRPEAAQFQAPPPSWTGQTDAVPVPGPDAGLVPVPARP